MGVLVVFAAVALIVILGIDAPVSAHRSRPTKRKF